MFPNDPRSAGPQPLPQPQQPYQPQPQFGYGSAPVQHPSGQYEVVPPLPGGQNNGHTGHNAYEFIMAPQTPKRRLFTPGSGKSFILMITLIVGGVVVVMIVAAIVLSALTPKGATPGLTAIAERQQEIIRISDAAVDQATGQDTLNFVTNVDSSIISGQQQVISYLAKHGTKLDKKTLALDQDTKTDDLLASAASANNYDSAVAQTLASQLQTYANLLSTTYHQTTNKQSQALLQSNYNDVQLLLKEAKALPANSNT